MKVGFFVSTGIHTAFLVLGVLQGNCLWSLSSPLTYFFWLFVALSAALSVCTAYRDPGFCPSQPPPLPSHAKTVSTSSTVDLKGLKTHPSTAANTPFVTNAQQDEEHQEQEDKEQAQLDLTSHLEVSMEVSSSCKESEFQDLPDARLEDLQDPQDPPLRPPNPVQRVDEIEILLPESTAPPVSPVSHADASPPAESDQRSTELLRFCTACNADQPLRAKHCAICGRCVARFDHHCPWLSICIGEKNHCWFLTYLIVQCVEMVLGAAALAQEIAESEMDLRNCLRLVLLGVGGVLLLLLVYLLLYQSVLIALNLTTWEYRSWGKITYLKSQPRSCESPFNHGVQGNLCAFLRASFNKELAVWHANPQTPALPR